MKSLMKLVLAYVCAMSLVACGARSKHVNLKKEGTQYTIGDTVTFYYPNSFELDSIGADNSSIQFHNGEEAIVYLSIPDDTENEVDDRDDLYTGELEQRGASNIVISKPILDSGLTVYEITGNYVDTGTKFKHIAYFTPENTYIYGYVATSEVYDENIKIITQFLQSIVINEPK